MIEQEEEKVNLIPKTSYGIRVVEDAEPYENNEEEEIVTNFKKYLEKNMYMWDVTNVEDYQFVLPSTVFSEEKKINFTLFEESEITYDDSYISRSLTPEQLEEIWQKGQFTVKSKNAKQPYVWQLSQWLHKGREGVNQTFCEHMGSAYNMLYSLQFRFSTNPKSAAFNTFYSVYFFQAGIKDLFHVFFGRTRYSDDYISSKQYPDSYLYPTIFREYQKNLLKEHPEIMISIYYPKFQALISKINSDFQTKWDDEKIIIEHDLQQQDLTAKEIKEKLSEIRFNKWIDEYQKSPKIDDKRKKYFIDTMKAERVYTLLKFEFDNKKSEAKNKILEEIKKDHPIRSTIEHWRRSEAAARYKIVETKLEEELDKRLDEELNPFPIQKIMITSFRTFAKYKKQNMELELEKKKEHYANVTYIYPEFIPPYEVKSNEYKQVINGVEVMNKTYQLVQNEQIPLTANHFFWRFKVLLYRIYYYGLYNNFVYIWYWCCWNHSFGLKALFVKEMYGAYSCDYLTGVVTPTHPKFTYISALSSLYSSISKSREDYEKAADKGFLGSKTGNFLNLMENYVFKLIFGTILIGLIYPCFILLWTAFFIAFILVWSVLVIIGLILGYFFCIFIFDFDNPNYQSNSCLPIFFIFFKRFVIQFFLNLVGAILAIIGQIILFPLICLWAMLTWCCRSLYDGMTFCIIKCNGNIPKADTSFAWRISGPGTSRTVFYKLEIEEALLLVRAELEKFQLREFEKEIEERLDSPMTLHNKLNSRIMKKLDGVIHPNQKLSNSITSYKNKLLQQSTKRYKIYPVLSNQVRFTQDDLDILLEATHDLVKEFVQTHILKSIWKQNGLMPDNWRSLTEKVLIRTFNSEDVLINVDESELKTDKKKNEDAEINEMFENVGINRHKQRAMFKKSNFWSMGASSSKMAEDDGDYYHTSYKPRNRIRQAELDQIQVASEVNINNLYNEHLKIEYLNLGIDQEKLKAEGEIDVDNVEDQLNYHLFNSRNY